MARLSFENTLRRALEALRATGVPYFLTGAQAVAIYGEPRTTRDVDIVVAGATEPRLRQLALTLRKAGFRLAGELVEGHNTALDIQTPYRLAIKIKRDVEETVEVEALGGRMRLTTPEALLVLKLEYGSEQDIRDARSILARTAGKLDLPRLRRFLRGKPQKVGHRLRQLLLELSHRQLLEQL